VTFDPESRRRPPKALDNMKLISFEIEGRPSFGVLDGESVVDVGRHLPSPAASLKEVLCTLALGKIERFASAPADYGVRDVVLREPIPWPGKIVCVGRNYASHAAEVGLDLPAHPNLFVRLPQSVVAHGQLLRIPALSEELDYEGELALVIGKPGWDIAPREALNHVAGYSCFNDGSVRDYQFQHSLTAGKNFLHSGSFGPCLVTADEIPHPDALTVLTRINGVELQHGHTADLIFDIPFLISYVSRILPLEAGDVISTGTPDGVGLSKTPPRWLRAGDLVEVEIPGVGLLCNGVASAEG
jgi:2-keto-4-pentenoate hydratase/2-oxohepta-3-ene-1,7-dioic acid hydratase in catechol pathway